MTQKSIFTELQDHQRVLEQTVAERGQLIHLMVDAIFECFLAGHKVLLCGNGGSAADAQHVAAEFVNRFRIDRRALPALALTTDSSVLTSIANDSSFGDIFSRQVEALGSSADVLLCISTSGRSANVLKALAAARGRGMVTIGLTGEKGRQAMGALCDLCLVVPSADTARIQECHEFVLHVLCGLVETRLHEIRPKSEGGVG